METIHSIDELINNLRTIEDYLTSDDIDKASFAEDLIRRGTCFVAYKASDQLRFAPSRFIGYLNNSLYQHIDNSSKHGNITNRAIRQLLGREEPNEELDDEYKNYCNSLGINPPLTGAFGNQRKFWVVELGIIDFVENLEMDDEFPEGKLIERTHKRRERNKKLIELKKSEFLKNNGKIFCEVCEFDFKEKYGERGTNFCEVHHTIAVSEMNPGHRTSLDELVIVCANCHRMIHKERPWLTMNELTNILT
jgi:hypothetical protein